MGEDKSIKIGKQILNQDDITKVLLMDGDSFKLKVPTPVMQTRIEREIAMRLGGMSLDSFPSTQYNQIRMITTLDLVIVDAPEWWTSASECYDNDKLIKIWDEYLNFVEEFRRSLREGKFKRGS